MTNKSGRITSVHPVDEGYPVRSTSDGIDTSRHPEGAMNNMLQVERPVSHWNNSKTGAPMEKPEYADD